MVFIVHGHDDGYKETVARFLSRLGLEPIILHEQVDRGRTIIQKFRDYADVAFAVALFTPDDVGGIASQVKTVDDLKPRARQNVVFEFGYFVGTLPQGNAVALVKGDVELPVNSDGEFPESAEVEFPGTGVLGGRHPSFGVAVRSWKTPAWRFSRSR